MGSVQAAINEFKGLSAEQTKQRILSKQNSKSDDDDEEISSHGNTGLPYGLCKKHGIALPDNATPRDAWDALKGIGLTLEQVYADLERKEKQKRKLIQDGNSGNTTIGSADNTHQKTSTSHMCESAKANFDSFQVYTSSKHLLHEEAIACSSNGDIVISKRGASHRVSFTYREAEQLRGADLIHNHPSHSSVLSPNDADSSYDQVKSCTMCDLDGNRMSIVYDDDITVQERIRFANAYAIAFNQAQTIAMKEYLKNPQDFRDSLYSDIKRKTRYYQDYGKYQQIVKDEIMKWAQANASNYKVGIYYEQH